MNIITLKVCLGGINDLNGIENAQAFRPVAPWVQLSEFEAARPF